MDEGIVNVVDSDGADRLSLSHVEETACTSRSSRSASVKAAGAWKSLQKWLWPGETLAVHRETDDPCCQI